MDENINLAIETIVKGFTTLVLKGGIEKGKKQLGKVSVVFEFCFTEYLKRSYKQYSTIKTLLYRDRPVDLKKHYVATDFTIDDIHIFGKDLFDNFKQNNRNVVIGTAGSGKSVLFRRLFIDVIDKKNGYIPVLIELRLLLTPEKNTL